MRFVLPTDNAVELNYMWLPSWLGHNQKLKEDIEKEIGPKVVGREMTEEVLEEANQMVIEYICEKYQVPGLKDYLDGLKFVGL